MPDQHVDIPMQKIEVAVPISINLNPLWEMEFLAMKAFRIDEVSTPDLYPIRFSSRSIGSTNFMSDRAKNSNELTIWDAAKATTGRPSARALRKPWAEPGR